MPNEKISKKKLQSQRTREKILEIATAAFGENGYAGCSLDLLANAAGLTKGAIYTHFPSKSALFITIIECAYKSALGRALLLKENTGFTDAIIELLYECMFRQDFPIDHKLWAEVLAVASREPEVRKVFLFYQSELRKIIENWMSEGKKAGEINPQIDIKSVSDLIFVLGNGLVVRLRDEAENSNAENFKIFENTIREIIKL